MIPLLAARHRPRHTSTWTAVAIAAAVTAGLLAAAPSASADPGADLTDNGGTITAQYESGSAAENYPKLIDNDVSTKYFMPRTTGWVQYRSAAPAVVDRYTITSANDATDRDPKDWTLQGSSDGTTWTTLDTRTDQTFAGRGRTRGFAVAGSAAYSYYRLAVSKNNGAGQLQFAEWELWAGGDGVPQAPSGLSASAVSANEVDLAWSDNSGVDTGYTETGFRIERSTDGTTFRQVATAGADATTYTDTGLTAGTTYHYRVRAAGAGEAASAWSNTAKAVTATSADPIDITDLAGTVTDKNNITGDEGRDKAVDNTLYTKYLTYDTTTWLQYAAAARSTVTGYTLTSANDSVARDPKNWTLQGSSDGTAWTTLDSRTGETFSARFQKKAYTFTNSTAYRYFRLNITANAGDSRTQLAEWQILGTGSPGSTPAPEAPTALTAKAVTGDQTELSWSDNSRWETAYRVERSTDGTTWGWSRTLPAGTTRYQDLGLTGRTTYQYRVRAENGTGSSAYTSTASATTGAPDLPAVWQEHWLEHTQSLSRVYYDGDVGIYFDPDVDKSKTWVYDYVAKLWRYTKQNYGSFSNPRLAAIFHQGKYGGGHPATVFDAGHDNRNVIDVGLGSWNENDAQARDMTAHEIGHVVESSAKGVNGSPSFPLWGDSKWAEIYQYDAYLGTGLTADADRWHTRMLANRDNFPRANTAWYKDWFHPIWRDHGKGAVLSKYFQVLADNYQKHNGKYARDMNYGEFVHFWSGAAGVNLKARATTAFGWPAEYEQQFKQAQIDFPDVKYPRT
nr:fibronectin type III domain-containing protein [Streptomyces sp. NBC_00857]